MGNGNETVTETGNNAVPKLRWNDSNMKSSYANVCNVASTREEVILLFGINQAWQRGQSEVEIQLTDRIILSPFAAKRFSNLLNNVLKGYEAKFGALPVDVAPAPAASPVEKKKTE